MRSLGSGQSRGTGVSDIRDRREHRLLERMARGDEDAFSELFKIYSSVAMGLAVRIIGDRTIAEEVVQDVFVSAWKRAGTYDASRGSARTWLLTQVHHRAVDVIRHEDALRKRSMTTYDPREPAPSPDDIVEEAWIADRRKRVRAAMERLPAEQREVLELAYLGGKTQAEVAKATGVPLGTVKSRTLTAMRRLRGILDGGDNA